jgi:hypothetical protein
MESASSRHDWIAIEFTQVAQSTMDDGRPQATVVHRQAMGVCIMRRSQHAEQALSRAHGSPLGAALENAFSTWRSTDNELVIHPCR